MKKQGFWNNITETISRGVGKSVKFAQIWFYQGQNNDRAIEIALEILAEDLNSLAAMHELGVTYRLKENYVESTNWFVKVLGIDQRNNKALNGLGINYREIENYQQAIAYFKQSLNIDRNNGEAMTGLAITYREMGEYAKAVEQLNIKLEVYPNDKETLHELGVTYRESGDYDKAVEFFEKLLDSNPEDKQALNSLGLVYIEKEDFDQAIGYLNDEEILNELGVTYQERGDYNKAIRCFEKLLVVNPESKQGLYGLAIVYLEQKAYDKATEYFKRFKRVDAENRDALMGLGFTYFRAESYPDAIIQFEAILKVNANDEAAQEGLRQAYEQMGPTPEAVECLKQWLDSCPENSLGHTLLREIAQKYSASGKTKEARAIVDFLRELERRFSSPESAPDGPPDSESESLKIQQLENAIQQQEAELLHSRQMASLGTMASGLAHEIAQPLQLILAISQNCNREIQRNAIDTEGILKDLNQIATTTQRIDKIVNHLHVLSRERKPQSELVDVNTVIENSFIMFHHQLKSRSIEIKQNFSENLPLIKADAIQLEQVFINLISNARDALEGVKDKTITISTEAVNGYIRVEFHDSGVGITAEDLPKIFDPFFTTKENGMGLGLHISHDIIEFYNGIITAQSDINEGTTFIIQLPIAKKENSE